ncbi:MAG: hypothetical protein JJU45_03635 [Acidimicrobiia bacterium]|nr:hypothetical protein [Acidimicrobiia bacterium]
MADPPDVPPPVVASGLVTDGRIDLPSALRRLGVPEEDINDAVEGGTIELFALERIVEGAGPRYDVDEVAELAGVDPAWILALWRALGFPEPRRGEKVFSSDDLDMLTDTVPFIAQGGLDSGLALQMTRVIGSSVARIAAAQVDAIASELEHRRDDEADPGEDDADSGGGVSVVEDDVDQEVAQRAATLLPMMPKVMEFVWRRHLGHAARRRLLRSVGGASAVCVGFADLVGFTAHTQQLGARELAEMVDRFESTAFDIVAAHGGRVIKMIGDEVMFCADDVASGAAIALGMAATFGGDEAFSDVRVGMAAGDVLERDGDVYGPVVNLASRIVNLAYPGAVVVSEDVAEVLEDNPAVVVRSIRSHYLKDIGRVRLWTVRSADAEDSAPYAGARRQAARRQFRLEARRRRQEEALARARSSGGVVSEQLLTDVPALDQPTGEIEAVKAAVLDADLDDHLAEELLTDIEVARRLGKLEADAAAKAEAADLEAEEKIVAAEREARRKVREAEAEAHKKVAAALEEAEQKAERANAEAEKKVRKVAKDAERLALQAEREASKRARQTTRRRRRDNDD